VSDSTKYTPGPWIVSDFAGKPCDIVAKGPHREQQLAEVYFTDLPEGAGNARLIAAAPDLLAVVKALVYWDRKADDERISEEGELDGLYEICERARAAIAKAEGGSL
jgi:hypothetical protein